MRGIRSRITVLATAVVVIVLVVAGWWLVTAQRSRLTADLEEGLKVRNDELVAQALAGSSDRTITGQGDSDAVAQVVGPDGQVVASTANLAGAAPLAAPPTGDGGLSTVHVPVDDASYRILSRGVVVGGDSFIVHTGAPLDDVTESVAALVSGLLVAIPVAAAVLAAMIWVLVGRTLRPVEAIRAEVADITGSRLDRRVPVPGTGDEIADLATTMNQMLDRLEEASIRQQRFVSDASHELRSPLTRIRAELEVDLHHPESADLVGTHRSVLEEAAHLSRLVDELLSLARLDADEAALRREAVDLDDIVLREGRRIREDGVVEVDLTAVSGGQVLGDRDQLIRAVRNLADNAARHAESRVAFSLREDAGVVVLVVDDDGPGVPARSRDVIFERFARLDQARSADDGGSGLGLAITREIIEGHGGSIVLDDVDGGGARFVVTLPAGGKEVPVAQS